MLFNLRTWLVFAVFLLLLTDAVIVYPKFYDKPVFPNQPAILCEGIVTYTMFFMLIYSKLRKNIHIVYYLMHMLTLRLQLGFLNPVGDEVKSNMEGRSSLKQMT
jgi:hypothetical protein